MNLKKVIIISIILIILIIITGISLIIILNINENNINNTIEDPAILDISSKFENVIDYSNYSTISTLINAYFSNIALKDSEVVYNLLSQDYIAENNITPDNIFSTIKTQVSNSPICLIDNMYMSNDYNYPVYLAKGKVLDIKYQENDGNRMLIEQKIEMQEEGKEPEEDGTIHEMRVHGDADNRHNKGHKEQIKVYKERGINVNDDRARDEKRCVGMLFKTWNMGGNHFVWWN